MPLPTLARQPFAAPPPPLSLRGSRPAPGHHHPASLLPHEQPWTCSATCVYDFVMFALFDTPLCVTQAKQPGKHVQSPHAGRPHTRQAVKPADINSLEMAALAVRRSGGLYRSLFNRVHRASCSWQRGRPAPHHRQWPPAPGMRGLTDTWRLAQAPSVHDRPPHRWPSSVTPYITMHTRFHHQATRYNLAPSARASHQSHEIS